jgi:hypothetical protein
MGRWTAEHSRFLKSHGFNDPRSWALNATGLTRREYQAALSRDGKLFAYGLPPCKNGHTLRTTGGCPQCNTQYLSYVRHNVTPGYVYIARSNSTRLVKVGLSADFNNRLYIANLEGYADIWDWIVRDCRYVQEMGRVEAGVKRALASYGVNRVWIRNGKFTTAKEVFSCTLKLAREALHREAARM